MDLLNTLAHMQGKAVLVNGTTYPIDKNGVAKGVQDVDAQKLLSSRFWLQYDAEALEERKQRQAAAKAAHKRRSLLINSQGEAFDPKAAVEPEPALTAEELPLMKAPEAPAPPPIPDPPDIPPSAPATEAVPEGPPEIPAEGGEAAPADGEWPDPKPEMKKAYLQQMADAYELQHNPKMTKQELVDLINEAMYG